MNTKLNIKDSLLSESKVYKHFMVLLFMAFTVTTICKAQNTIIDDDGQAAIFFINDYPHASDVFWGNDDLAANGITACPGACPARVRRTSGPRRRTGDRPGRRAGRHARAPTRESIGAVMRTTWPASPRRADRRPGASRRPPSR